MLVFQIADEGTTREKQRREIFTCTLKIFLSLILHIQKYSTNVLSPVSALTRITDKTVHV